MTDTSREFVLDLDSLTIDEVEQLEDAADQPYPFMFADMKTALRPALMRALALILLRRDNPDATADEAGSITYSEMIGAIRQSIASVVGPVPADGDEPVEDPPT